MRVKILFYTLILCLLTVAGYGQELPSRTLANEYLKLGLFYEGLFNTLINRQINYYNALFYIINNKDEIYRITGKEAKFSTQEISHIHYYRGLCYYYEGNYKQAIADFKNVHSSSDRYFEAMITLGACYYKQGKWKEANGLWDKVYLMKKKDAMFLSKLGNLYAELGINKEKVIQYCKNHKIGKVGLAWLSLKEGRFDNALNLMKEIETKTITEIRFYDPDIFRLKSQIYLGLTERHYQNTHLVYKLGKVQFMSGKLGKCVSTLGSIVNSNNGEIRANALITLGAGYYLLGETKKADKYWDDVMRNYQNNPVMMRELGYTYARLGIRLDKALSLCESSSYHSGIVYFKKGLIENNNDYLMDAPGLLEKGLGYPKRYNPERHKPLFFLELSNAYYCIAWFDFSIQILDWLLEYYPEVEGVSYISRDMAEMWKTIKFFPEFKLRWKDIWY